eukprot:m.143809 g.143809  ORF g.143809 m.143809 type:complete len:384 (-) comp16749_c1_seq2:352-1503(-)
MLVLGRVEALHDGRASCIEAEHGRRDVLDANTGIGAGESYEKADVLGEKGHDNRRHDRQEREPILVKQRWNVNVTLLHKRLEVVAQCDGNDWEVGAESKDREQREKVGDELHVEVLEVQRVQVFQVAGWESEDGGEAEQHVKGQDHDKVDHKHAVEPALRLDGHDKGGQAVVAHEGVDGRAKELWHATNTHGRHRVGCGRNRVRVAEALVAGDADGGQGDHDEERCPAKDGGADLQPLGLLHVEEAERAQQHRDHCQIDVVGAVVAERARAAASVGVIAAVVAGDTLEALRDGNGVDAKVAVEIDDHAGIEELGAERGQEHLSHAPHLHAGGNLKRVLVVACYENREKIEQSQTVNSLSCDSPRKHFSFKLTQEGRGLRVGRS